MLLASPALCADKVTYRDHVLPVFRNRCLSCHNTEKAKGGLDLSTYTGVLGGGSAGEIVASGNPDDSSLYLVISHQEEPKMPPKADKLSDAEINIIKQWIDAGLLEDAGSKGVKKKKTFDLALSAAPTGKPEGPPPMPEHPLMEPVVVTERTGALASIAVSPWAPLVAVASNKQVLLYNTDTLKMVGVLPFPEGYPQALSFSRNGSLILAGGGRGGQLGRVVVWSVATGRRVIQVGEELDAVLGADISADQSMIALGGPSKRLKIHSTADGELLYNIKKHTEWIMAMAYSPDGVLLATADRNGGLYVWETYTGGEFYVLEGHKKAITSLSWRGDSNVLASASEDGTIRLWEMFEGKQVRSANGHANLGVLSVHFAADGRLVTTGRDRHVRIWDAGGKQIKVLPVFKELPLQAVFTQDGKRIITGDWSGIVKAWNAEDGKEVGRLDVTPPPLSMRLAEAQKLEAERQPPFATAEAAYKAAEAAAVGPRAKLAEVQKSVEKAAAEVNAAQAKVTALKAQVIKATSDHADAAKVRETTKAEMDRLAKAAGDAEHHRSETEIEAKRAAKGVEAAKVSADKAQAAADAAKAAAEQAKEDAALAEALAKATAAADAARAELAKAQQQQTAVAEKLAAAAKAATDAKTAADKATAAHTAAEKSVAACAAAIKSTNEQVAAAGKLLVEVTARAAQSTKVAAQRGEEVKAAAEKLAGAKKVYDQTLARLTDAKNRVARWQAEQINVQLFAARDALEARRDEHEQATAVQVDSKRTLDQTNAALEAAKKILADAPGAVKQKEGAFAKAKEQAQNALAALKTAEETAASKQTLMEQVKAQAQVVAQRAEAEPENKLLADASAKIGESLALVTKDHDAARNVIGGRQAELTNAEQSVTAAESALKQAQAVLAEAPKTVETRTAAATESKTRHDAAVTAMAAATEALKKAEAQVEKLASQYLAKLPK